MPPLEDEPENPYEDAPWRSVSEMLAEQGFTPTPSSQVNKFALRGRLWEFIYALAGKRLFFFHTDHLSDREFYNWLERNWLPGQAADLPPESEWNCHVDVSESGTMVNSAEKLALRYYADDATRASWQREHPGQTIPPHQPLPFHRDQHLPRPHAPITKAWPLPGFVSDLEPLGLDDIDRQAIEEFGYDEDEDDDDEDFDEENDPLGLAAVDREIQRRGLVVQEDPDDFLPSANLTPDAFSSDFNPDEETFLRPIDILRQRNYSPLPMAELTDETVAPALWELLHELCRMNFFIVHTDHLSDAVLYHELTRTVLYQKVIIPELIETAACYHDCLHQREDEALQLWLKYYATGPQRLKWETQNTAEALPPSVEPPYQRDWHLPQLPVRP